MQEEPLITAQKKFFWPLLSYTLGVFVFTGSGVYMLSMAFNTVYVQLIPLLFGTGLLAGIWFMSRALLKLEGYHLYKDRLEILSLTGNPKRTVYYKDIDGYAELDKAERSARWKHLVLYTTHGNCEISGRYYTNYEEMKQRLIEGKVKDAEAENKDARKTLKQLCALFAGFALLSAGVTLCFIFQDNRPAEQSAVTHISGVITNQPEISHVSRGSDFIRIYLEQHPAFVFDIKGAAYRSMQKQPYLHNVVPGDTLYLGIAADDYLKKLTRKKKLSFFDKTVNYRFIKVYELSDSNYNYLLLTNYTDSLHTGVSSLAYIFGASTLLALLVCGFFYHRYQEITLSAGVVGV